MFGVAEGLASPIAGSAPPGPSVSPLALNLDVASGLQHGSGLPWHAAPLPPRARSGSSSTGCTARCLCCLYRGLQRGQPFPHHPGSGVFPG